MNSKTIVNERTGFEVYLEGIKAPPASIRISENEGGFPSAQVSFPATSAMLRILPGTKVQIFGKDPKTDDQIILFEGEINSVGYNKSGSSRSVSFSCVSPLSKWASVTARPLDAMITPIWREAERGHNFNYENLTQDQKQNAIQRPTSVMAAGAFAIKSKIEQEVSGPLKEVLDEATMTNFSGYSDEIIQILEKDSVNAGDIHILVQYFLKKFEIADPFYGMDAAAYNISNSVSTWPNFGKVDPFKNKAAMESFSRMATEFKDVFKKSGSLVLLDALKSILQTMHYNLLSPASYTSSHRFQDGGGTPDGTDPIRAYFTPNLENSPPAKFNLLFPHQVMSFNYSRAFGGEPTRTIGEIKLNYLDSSVVGMEGASAFITEPGLNITQRSVEENSIGFTPEETYRGIKPNVAGFNRFFAEAKQSFMGPTQVMKTPEKEDYLSLVKPGLTQLTKNSHMRSRMNGRSVSFQTTWSPYRMAGVPGAYIEQGDGPSITGVISSITTNITANGNATSTITFRSPRLVYKKDDVDDDANLINDFSLDPYLDINTFLFDEEVYDFNNIGGSLFAYLKHGKFSKKNEALKRYASNPIQVSIKETVDKETTVNRKDFQPFEDNAAKIKEMFGSGQVVNEDASIIDFLKKDEDNNILNALAPELEMTSEEDYTRNVYEAIYNITDLYENIDGQGSLIDRWTNNITHRNIITKRDYFDSLGILKPESLKNCKDGIKLFTGTEVLSSVKDTLVTNNTNSGTDSLDESQLTSKKKTLENRIALIRNNLSLLENVGAVNNSNIRVVVATIDTLRDQPLRLEIERVPSEDVDMWRPEYKTTAIEKAKSKEAALVNERNSVIEKLEEISDKVVEDIEIKSVAPEFESELFKPYNLTRRRHVDVALTRYVRNSLKSQTEDDPESDIRQNLNILE